MKFNNFEFTREWSGATLSFADARDWCADLDTETSAKAATLKPEVVSVDRSALDAARVEADQARADLQAAERAVKESDKKIQAALRLPPDQAQREFALVQADLTFQRARADVLRAAASAADRALQATQAKYNAALDAEHTAALKAFVAEQETLITKAQEALPASIRQHLVVIGAGRKAINAAKS